jgi:hypothetical protein
MLLHEARGEDLDAAVRIDPVDDARDHADQRLPVVLRTLLLAVGVVPDLGVGGVAGDQPIHVAGLHAVEEALGEGSHGVVGHRASPLGLRRGERPALSWRPGRGESLADGVRTAVAAWSMSLPDGAVPRLPGTVGRDLKVSIKFTVRRRFS